MRYYKTISEHLLVAVLIESGKRRKRMCSRGNRAIEDKANARKSKNALLFIFIAIYLPSPAISITVCGAVILKHQRVNGSCGNYLTTA
jgi:hypothetical protein